MAQRHQVLRPAARTCNHFQAACEGSWCLRIGGTGVVAPVLPGEAQRRWRKHLCDGAGQRGRAAR